MTDITSKLVLIIIGSLDLGGTEKHITETVAELNRDLYRIVVYTLCYPGDLAEQLAAKGIQVLSMPWTKQQWQAAWRLKRGLLLLRSAWQLVKIMRQAKPDIVHYYLPMSYLIGGLCAKWSACHCQIMSRRSLNTYQAKHRALAWLEKKWHRQLTYATGNSQAVIDDLNAEGINSERLLLMYNGIDVTKYDLRAERNAIRSQQYVAADTVVITIVANLIPYKGHRDLLAAMSYATKIISNWTLWCIGHDTSHIQASLIAYANQLGIDHHIQFLGQRDDIPALLNASDIGVLCSHEEGFSNSILESMAAGLPMVVTDVGGNAEAVLHNKTGLVVPAKQSRELGRAIAELALDASLRKVFADAGRMRIKAEFSLEQSVKAYELLYHLALEQVATRT